MGLLTDPLSVVIICFFFKLRKIIISLIATSRTKRFSIMLLVDIYKLSVLYILFNKDLYESIRYLVKPTVNFFFKYGPNSNETFICIFFFTTNASKNIYYLI